LNNKAVTHRLFPLGLAILALALLLFVFLLGRFSSGRAQEAAGLPYQFRIEFALNTVCIVSLFDQTHHEVYEEVFRRIREIEGRMSRFLPNSDISRVNAAAGFAPVQVQDDVFMVIQRALYIAELSGGAFDPSVGPLAALWDIMGANPHRPTKEEINAVLPLVNWRNVELDHQQRTVFLRLQGMALDLGAIAKGYAADQALAIIRAAGVERALVNLGGDVIAHGERPDGTPWRVGLQTPHEELQTALGVIRGRDMTVMTSGMYERYFIYDEVLYHHLFSPFDGHPARTGLLSVTVVSDVSMDADALSTAIFVLGYERGRALVDSLEGVEAVFVFEDRRIRVTPGVDFVLADDSFRIVAD